MAHITTVEINGHTINLYTFNHNRISASVSAYCSNLTAGTYIEHGHIGLYPHVSDAIEAAKRHCATVAPFAAMHCPMDRTRNDGYGCEGCGHCCARAQRNGSTIDFPEHDDQHTHVNDDESSECYSDNGDLDYCIDCGCSSVKSERSLQEHNAYLVSLAQSNARFDFATRTAIG